MDLRYWLAEKRRKAEEAKATVGTRERIRHLYGMMGISADSAARSLNRILGVMSRNALIAELVIRYPMTREDATRICSFARGSKTMAHDLARLTAQGFKVDDIANLWPQWRVLDPTIEAVKRLAPLIDYNENHEAKKRAERERKPKTFGDGITGTLKKNGAGNFPGWAYSSFANSEVDVESIREAIERFKIQYRVAPMQVNPLNCRCTVDVDSIAASVTKKTPGLNVIRRLVAAHGKMGERFEDSEMSAVPMPYGDSEPFIRKRWGYIFCKDYNPSKGRRVDYMFIRPGGETSMHCHNRLSQRLRVLNGTVTVKTLRDHGYIVERLTEKPGQPSTTEIVLKPGDYHQIGAPKGKGYDPYNPDENWTVVEETYYIDEPGNHHYDSLAMSRILTCDIDRKEEK